MEQIKLDYSDIHFAEVQHLVAVDAPLLNQAMPCNHHEELPFGIVPMLTLGDSRLGDVHRYLTTVLRAEQLCETSPGIDIHLQREGHFLFRKIGEIG